MVSAPEYRSAWDRARPSQGFNFGAQPVMPSINPHTSPLVQPGATLLTPQSGNTVPGAPQPASQV
ncbi:MAG: hypothetical protein R3D26_02310 [Cyanobacteriota/Melainabacteria group bacterium]